MKSEIEDIPASARLLALVTAGWTSAAISASAELGIADALADGPRTTDELAVAVDADPRTLYRLLRACADLGLFDEFDGEVFVNTDLGSVLRSDVPGSLRQFARWTATTAERSAWGELARSVRAGRPAFADVHGRTVWEYLSEHRTEAETFDKAMSDLSALLAGPVVAGYDFGSFGTVVDVAGGRGALLSAVLSANRETRGVLYDRPEVVAAAVPALKAAGIDDRCSAVAGDIFASVPAGGDAYLLSNVLHDWDDEQSVRILRNCRAGMAEHGRVLLVEAVLPAEVEPAATVKLMDLDMLLLCGGKQRSAPEFAELFAAAGLRLANVVPGIGGLHSIVEAVRS